MSLYHSALHFKYFLEDQMDRHNMSHEKYKEADNTMEGLRPVLNVLQRAHNMRLKTIDTTSNIQTLENHFLSK